MPRHVLVSLCLWFVACGLSVSALELKWLPADPDAPLPLSSEFRRKLGKLCTIVEDRPVSSQPPELVAKREHLLKLCAQLRQGRRLTRSATPLSGFAIGLARGIKKLTVCGLTLGLGRWILSDFSQRGQLWRYLRQTRQEWRRFRRWIALQWAVAQER